MSELTDLEKLKKEVKTLKSYLRGTTRYTLLIYDHLLHDGLDWEESKKFLLDKYDFLDFIAKDFLNDNNINKYYDKYFIEGDSDYKLLEIMRENERRERQEKKTERGETINMSKEDFSVSRGGKRKTRKNRKPRK